MPDDDMDLDGGESQDIVYVKLNHNHTRHELSTGASLKLYRGMQRMNGATTREHETLHFHANTAEPTVS